MKSNIEKRSKLYGDTYHWVLKVIGSCKTQEQKLSCYQLIENWYMQTRRQYPNYNSMIDHLRHDLLIKLDY